VKTTDTYVNEKAKKFWGPKTPMEILTEKKTKSPMEKIKKAATSKKRIDKRRKKRQRLFTK